MPCPSPAHTGLPCFDELTASISIVGAGSRMLSRNIGLSARCMLRALQVLLAPSMVAVRLGTEPHHPKSNVRRERTDGVAAVACDGWGAIARLIATLVVGAAV